MGFTDKPNKIIRSIILTSIIAIIIILIIVIVINIVENTGDYLYLLALVAIPVSIWYISKNPTKTIYGYGQINGGVFDWLFGKEELTPDQITQKIYDSGNYSVHGKPGGQISGDDEVL